MVHTQLGKKLKEARLIKKMTQSDVVGTFITRNMLSQIESGAAFPSLKTLEYLANTLEIPIHYLISEAQLSEREDDSATDITPVSTERVIPASDSSPAIPLIECKAAYLRGDYTYVIERASELDDKNSRFYDEGVALLARACLRTAEKLMRERMESSRSTKSIAANARLAARYGEIGIYASREVRTEALLLLDELTNN